MVSPSEPQVPHPSSQEGQGGRSQLQFSVIVTENIVIRKGEDRRTGAGCRVGETGEEERGRGRERKETDRAKE